MKQNKKQCAIYIHAPGTLKATPSLFWLHWVLVFLCIWNVPHHLRTITPYSYLGHWLRHNNQDLWLWLIVVPKSWCSPKDPGKELSMFSEVLQDMWSKANRPTLPNPTIGHMLLSWKIHSTIEYHSSVICMSIYYMCLTLIMGLQQNRWKCFVAWKVVNHCEVWWGNPQNRFPCLRYFRQTIWVTASKTALLVAGWISHFHAYGQGRTSHRVSSSVLAASQILRSFMICNKGLTLALVRTSDLTLLNPTQNWAMS